MVRCRAFVLLVALPLAYAEAHAQAQTPTLPPPSRPAQSSTQPNTQAPAPARSAATPPAVPHAIVVTFDYDFNATPACAAQVREKCVTQFVIYDISGGPQRPFRIGIVPLPDNPSGKKQGI